MGSYTTFGPYATTGYLDFSNLGTRVLWTDLDADGKPDLFITNDLNPGQYRILGDLARNAPPAKAAGPVADRVRRALDTHVTLNYNAVPVMDVLNELQKTYGLPLTVKRPDMSYKVTLSFEDQPLGAVLQAITDVYGVEFFLRDYGVLVAVAGQPLPPGAVRVHDFWKSKPKTDESANPPAGDVEGLIRAVEDNGLVKLSIGSDAGLAKGHTLEVFRVSPTPRYLGRLRIIEVSKSEAVGETVGRMLDRLKVGDRVGSRIIGSTEKDGK
jgi:hypothetical protein